MKLTKTEVKVRRACAFQGVCDMTVLLEHINNGDLDVVRDYATNWLTEYQQRLTEYTELQQETESAWYELDTYRSRD